MQALQLILFTFNSNQVWGKFIKQLIFLIPLLIIFILLEYTIRQIPNTYKYKNEWMLTFETA